AKSERSLVDARPGTTRDPVDVEIEFQGRRFVIVDTAGIRRRSRIEDSIEAASALRALRTLERAEVVILMCDASEGVAEQDARLLGLCADRGAGVIVAHNKTDLLDKKTRVARRQQAEQ